MSHQKVFILDDNAAARQSLCALVAASLEIETSAYDSVEAFLESGDQWQDGCVISDMRMPGMSGVDLMDVLARDGIKLPVILITGCVDTTSMDKSVGERAVAVLEKPCHGQVLLDAVEKALRRAAACNR